MRRLRKRVRENVREEEVDGERRFYIHHGDIILDFKDARDAEVMKSIVRAFNYLSLEEVHEITYQDTHGSVHETEIACDELVKKKLMWKYTINGERFYVLNKDKKDYIKKILEDEG